MEKFTKLEQLLVINALSHYEQSGVNEEVIESINVAKNKLMPILLGKTKEEFEAGAAETLKQVKKDLDT